MADHRDRVIDAPARPIREGRVGLIVAGSLITGFVVALLLVIGPFGGAQEHVIMALRYSDGLSDGRYWRCYPHVGAINPSGGRSCRRRSWLSPAHAS